MFDVFRKHTKVMMMVMFLLIIPSFVLFGIDGYNRMNDAAVAVAQVAGHDITQNQWDIAHKAEADRMRAAMPNLDAKMLDTPQARYATLERLVHERVLALAADQYHLSTSDARLARFLQEDATIASLRKADGKIDMDRYRQLAASQGLTPEGFENNVRMDLSRQQIEAGLRTSGFATAAVADTALNAFFDQREIQLLNFATTDYMTKVASSDAELEAYYQANSVQFQATEHAQIEYVVLDLDAVKKTIQLPLADVKAYYEQNVSRLSGTEERRASHILIAAPKDAAPDARQKAKTRAQELLKSVRAEPTSFASVARKNSQDPGSAAKGGDLDFFARGSMVKPFEEAVFAMNMGAISDIVESDFGFHIIQLTDIKKPKQRSFEELRTSMEADIKTQQAQRKFAEAAELFSNVVYEQSDSLKPVADKLKLEIQTASQVSRQAAAGKGVLSQPKFLSALFSADSIEKKRNTEAVEIAPNQLVAGRIINYQAARALPFAEVKESVRARVLRQKALELAQKEGQEKLALLTKDAMALTFPAPIQVARNQQQSVAQPIVDAALRSDSTKLPLVTGVSLGDAGYAVLRINKVLPRPLTTPAVDLQNRNQYAAWWTAAESKAFYAALKEQLKVRMLVPDPALTVTAK